MRTRFRPSPLIGRGMQLQSQEAPKVCPTCCGVTVVGLLTCPFCRKVECIACRAQCAGAAGRGQGQPISKNEATA